MDIKKILELLKGGKDKEAKKEFKEHLAAIKLSKEDRGQAQAELASVYLKANTQILKEYNGFLSGVAEELKSLNLKERELKNR